MYYFLPVKLCALFVWEILPRLQYLMPSADTPGGGANGAPVVPVVPAPVVATVPVVSPGVATVPVVPVALLSGLVFDGTSVADETSMRAQRDARASVRDTTVRSPRATAVFLSIHIFIFDGACVAAETPVVATPVAASPAATPSVVPVSTPGSNAVFLSGLVLDGISHGQKASQKNLNRI